MLSENLLRKKGAESMGKVILVTGGARSGKSSFSERMLSGSRNVLYIATATAFDIEMRERIRLHRKQRSEEWETLEAFDDLEVRLAERDRVYEGILLDCITVMTTNLLFHHQDFDENNLAADFWTDFEKEVQMKLKKLIHKARTMSETFIMVTNEIGMGLVPETPLSRQFRDVAGRINQMLAEEVDEVYFVVSGIPMKIKERNLL